MSNYGSNGAPRTIDQGMQDKSFRRSPISQLLMPQHLPVWYTWAERGPVGSNYLDLDTVDFKTIYGDETLEPRSPYYTHSIPFIQGCQAQANSCIVRRLVPTDIKDKSNVVLFIDILPIKVPLYQKNTDGSLMYDDNALPIVQVDGAGDPILVDGYRCAWVVDSFEYELGEYRPNKQTQRPGIQDEDGVQSTQYPIFELAARDVGGYGNKLCFSLSAINSREDNFPDYMLDEGKMYPYEFAMAKLKDARTNKTIEILNFFGSTKVTGSLKNDAVNPYTDGSATLDDIVNDTYIDVDVELSGGLGHINTYHENFEIVSKMLFKAEAAVVDTYRDNGFDADLVDENYAIFNIVSFTSSNTSPYQACKLVDLRGTTRLTRNSRIFLSKGTDGTMTKEAFEALVAADVDSYTDLLHPYTVLTTSPESIIYDTGFSLKTKKALCKFISRRKDTFVSLSTHIDGTELSVEEQMSLAVSLKTYMETYPESAFFNTPTVRGMITSGSGVITGSVYKNRVPLSYEIMRKSARYMGASNGKWVAGRLFDTYPETKVEWLSKIDITHVPVPTRVKFWTVGLNFVLDNDVKSQWFPGLKTVYQDDTSVLNNYFTVMAACYLNKLAHATWRKFSGSMSRTPGQLVTDVNEHFNMLVAGCFDNLFRITPAAVITEEDDLKGNSWTLPVKLEANNSKTVMTTRLEAYRYGDLDEN